MARTMAAVVDQLYKTGYLAFFASMSSVGTLKGLELVVHETRNPVTRLTFNLGA